LVQVVHVEDERAIEAARKAARLADAVLLDSGRPSLSELGGTGRVHDWAISRAIVQAAACPVILAGGLNAENVGRAMTEVRPYGLDLCSGVRTDDWVDPAKVQAFMAAVAKVH
jgi:phosphoribosylanthranilate isomerase